MDIAVIGIGAVGMFVASELHEKHNVTCYVRREEQRELIFKEGIIYNKKRINVKVKLIDELFQHHDLYIVCVKQTQLDTVLTHLHKVSTESHLLFLQNGLGHLHKINVLPQTVYLGINENGVLRLSDHEVKRTGIGLIKLSALGKEGSQYDNEIANALHHEHFIVQKSDELMTTLNEKLVVNSVINPLTAIFNVKNGQIVANKHIKKVAYLLAEEACEVLSLDVDVMWEKVMAIASNTKENYSSMVIDIQKGRKTEIDFINGYLIHKNPNLKMHQIVYHLVKGKECM